MIRTIMCHFCPEIFINPAIILFRFYVLKAIIPLYPKAYYPILFFPSSSLGQTIAGSPVVLCPNDEKTIIEGICT
jgi:hypothetical protein